MTLSDVLNNKKIEEVENFVQEEKKAIEKILFPYTDVLLESLKVTTGLVSFLAAAYFQQTTFDHQWANAGFYQQIRSGLDNQLAAGVVIGLSANYLYRGFKRVLCRNSNSQNVKIIQGATLIFASLGVKACALSLAMRSYQKINMAILLHDNNQNTLCKTVSQGWFSGISEVVSRYFW